MSGLYIAELTEFVVGPEETHVTLPRGLGEFTVPTAQLRIMHESVCAQLAAIDEASGE